LSKANLAFLVSLAVSCLTPMNARGERILIFGDSLTQHTGRVPIWDVDQGSNRNHAGPGDVLASLLLEQGASAVRVNAKGGRSGYNFWTVEPGAALIANDLNWKPTKIVFVMGTNDVGMTQGPDQAAYQKIYNGYKASKAEMLVIGPFLNRQDAGQREVVYNTLRNVFGAKNVIDGRQLTVNIPPGNDGIHYTTSGARNLGLSMADALLRFKGPQAWLGLAIGAAVVVGGALAYSFWRKRGRGLGAIELVDGRKFGGNTNELVRSGYRQVPCKSGLDSKGLARCWSRSKGLGLTGGARSPTRIESTYHGRPSQNQLEVKTWRGDQEPTIEIISSRNAEEHFEALLPAGFKLGMMSPQTPLKIEHGIPTREPARNQLFVVKPSELAKRGIWGNEINPNNLESVKQAWRDGVRLDPVLIDVDHDGRLAIEDGNHRLLAAATDDRPVVARFVYNRKIINAPFDVSGRLKKALPKAKRAPKA
jgi:hypothetical protein